MQLHIMIGSWCNAVRKKLATAAIAAVAIAQTSLTASVGSALYVQRSLVITPFAKSRALQYTTIQQAPRQCGSRRENQSEKVHVCS